MTTRFAGLFLLTAILAGAVTLGVSAQPGPPQAAAGGNAPPIRLRVGTFTPARGERPRIPDSMAIRDYSAGRRGYYIVQFDGPIEETWKASLSAAGADILDYIPEFAFKVRMTPREASEVARLPHVIWVGVFHPAYKLPPDIVRDAQVRPFVVHIEAGANRAETEAGIVSTGASVAARDARTLTVTANAAQIEAVAHVLDVAAIEAFAIRRKHNEFGGSIMHAEIAAAAGFDGSTQTIAISDTGLGDGTANAHQDIASGRIAAIFNWPGTTNFCFESVVHDGPVDVDTGHGTHVATSALGTGSSSGTARGTAPASRLVFQAIEDFVMPSLFCQLLLGLPPGYYLAGIPPDISGLFQQSYDAGARVHSNSWGSNVNGAYTEDSANTDAFVWTHRDLAITVSAGNAGADANRDGIVDTGSMNAPATAKNVITVGASEGDRGSHYECDTGAGAACAARGGQNDVFTYGAAFGASFPANPLKDDVSAGNAEQMAAFSSRGPTSDGRIKPDVVAPGTWILSGYSDRFQQYYDPAPNPQNGAFQYDGWGEPLNDKYKYMGGTSMSAPLVAGAAAVVRDYYQKAHGREASAALVKATLVNSAIDLLDENNDGVNDNAFPIPNFHEGWGRVDLQTATDGSRQFFDEASALTTGDTASQSVMVDASQRPLRITLAWTDAASTASAAKNLVNDLDLEVVAPDGTVYSGNAFLDGWTLPGVLPDRTNNLENVYVAAPAAGEWTVLVRGYNVPQGPQPYALVVGREAAPVQQLPRVSIQATDADAGETGGNSGLFTLSRSGDVSAELAVSYTVAGTATPGADYGALAGTATFPAGLGTVTVNVEPVDDDLVESNETVVVTVLSGEGYGIRTPAAATLTITSDDQPGDLIVTSVAAPSTAAGAATVLVTETTKNQGSWPIPSSQTGFYLSTNTSVDVSDVLLGSRAVSALAAGAAETMSTSLVIPDGIVGTYYIVSKADWNAAVPETNETNNARSSTSVRIGPDLVVSSLSVPPTAAAGATISVTDVTRNDGVQSAGGSVTAFYLSANSVIDGADVRLGTRQVPSLNIGGSDQASTLVTVPAATAVGSYYVIARADDTAIVGEATETNNTRHAPTLKIGADLVVASVSAPATAAPGGSLLVSDTTTNQGGAAAGALVTAFYLSTNSTFDTSDVRIGQRAIAALDPGQLSSASTTVAIPAVTAPGMYYLIANADDGKVVSEPLESNNARAASGQVKIGPDLTVVSISAPLTGGAGASLSLTDNIKNLGGASTPGTEAVFYLSSNTTLDAQDVEIARRQVRALDPNTTDTASTVVLIPSNTAVGTYYVIQIVDPADAVDEASESNNSNRSGTVRVGPDLTVSALSGSSTVAAGAVATFNETTRNAGGGAAASTITGYYLSVNTTLDATDVFLASRTVPALAAGASSAAATPVTVPSTLAAGTYYLIAASNDVAPIAETSASNNTLRFTVRVTQP